jgi:hypothetical protein
MNWQRWAACLTLATGLVPLWSQAVWAQVEEEVTEASKSWVPGYFVVLLGIGIGLFVICRPSTRRAEIRQSAE